MDIAAFLGSIQAIDLLLFLYFAGFFVLGFAQGTIRRLIGLASVLFSFFLAANLAEPLGDFLGANWRQFSPEYSYMVGFGTIFVAAALAFALVAQGWYKPQPLFEKARFVDELLGGLLGILLASTLFDAPAPADLIDEARGSPAVRALAEEARLRMLRTASPPGQMGEFLDSLNTHDRLRHRLWPLVTLLITRTVGDHQAMPLPKPLWGIYYLTRPFRLAGKVVVEKVIGRN